MEPVFMILGQSAATAAAMAIDGNLPVQKVPYQQLRERLQKDGQILQYVGPKDTRSVDPKKLQGIILDDTAAKLTGHWVHSSAAKSFLSDDYIHDGNAKDGQCRARFETKLPKAGKYRVMLAAAPSGNRATNAPFEIHHKEGVTNLKVNLKEPKAAEGLFWIDLGASEFGNEAAVSVTNAGTDGYVVVDGMRWIAE